MKTKILYIICLTFLISFSIIPGCSEDTPVTPPVTQNNVIVGTLVSNPNGIIVNSYDTVLFRFTVNPGTTFTNSVIIS